MQEQVMTIENALQILANVTGAYRGTRDEHRTIEAALNAVIGALQQNARPCEQKADKHDNVSDIDELRLEDMNKQEYNSKLEG